MSRLRILFVEDSASDADLEERELRKGGIVFESKRVVYEREIRRALDEFDPHLVICDYGLPGTDGLKVVQLVRTLRAELPFIFVSGTLGEERAIETLRNGATDYVLKDQMTGLVPKVRRALKEVEQRANNRRLEEHLRQAQKMEAIGRLAGGVAHDFNNLLTVINGYAQALIDAQSHDPNAVAQLTEIIKAGDRAATLTRQLLAFSRRQPLSVAPVNVNRIVLEMESMIRRLIGEDIDLVVRTPPPPGYVLGDPSQIEQILMNLAVNARDAMPGGGTLTIETSVMTAGSGDLASGRTGPHVLISVIDTGHGMDAETLAHIFEPFFTTKPPGKGTGLGLSAVYGIVTQAGGAIDVKSEPGQGCRLDVYLPRVDAAASIRNEPAAVPAPVRAGPKGVLVVEDFEPLRNLMVMELLREGFRVLVAKDGVEAVEVAKATQGIDLVVCDIVMPRMGGKEAAERIRASTPGMRFLFVTGYADQAIVDGLGEDILPKPFSPRELVGRVRVLMAKGGA